MSLGNSACSKSMLRRILCKVDTGSDHYCRETHYSTYIYVKVSGAFKVGQSHKVTVLVPRVYRGQ